MGALIINADDYAMDAGVDAAILALGKQGRVTAASAMVLSPRWADAALALKDSELSVGLHIDFTSPFADRFFTRRQLPALIIAAHARFLDSRFFEDEIDRQFDLFERGLHRPPGFIDGHQHVHHLPILRDALFRVLKNRYGSGAELIGLRVCAARRWRGLKAAIIGATGAFALARLAAVSGNPINSDFAGVYDFGGGELSVLWERWLDGLRGPLPLIMCHVAVECGESHASDPIRLARYREFRWLTSEAFAALLERSSAKPAYWPQALQGIPPERSGEVQAARL